jgi:hypothetical protein
MTVKGRMLAKGKAPSIDPAPVGTVVPTAKERAHAQAEKLARKISPRKTKLPVSTQIEATTQDPYLPLVATGIVLLPGTARPVFLLKHEATGDTLPVWMHPMDASVGLHELGQGALGSPHAVGRILLERLGVRQVECYFTERIGHHQFVRIEFLHEIPGAGPGLLKGEPIRVRADEVMSFCIAHKARFFSTKNFIAQCRVLNEELEKLQDGLLAGTANQAFPELEIGSKKSGYMM